MKVVSPSPNDRPKSFSLQLSVGVLLSALWMCSGAVEARAWKPETRRIDSQAVQRTLRYNVLLPAAYHDSDQPFPVLYLLHGINGNLFSWWSEAGLAAAAKKHDLIVILPDAGNFWYLNWSQEDRREDWESFIVDELIPHVDRSFRTIPRRQGRAIGGRSMGGYGALMLALRHPGLFVSVAGSSSYLDFARAAADELRRGGTRKMPRRRGRAPELEKALDDWRYRPDEVIATPGFSSLVERTPKGRPFHSVQDAESHDPYLLVRRLPKDQLPEIYLDCGLEDSLLGFTQELVRILLRERIPFHFVQHHGGHDDAYWNRAVEHLLEAQMAALSRAMDRGSQASLFTDELSPLHFRKDLP